MAAAADAMITRGHVHVKKIWGIPQFWLVWLVLCMNVSAGIGVIGLASPMLQEIFGGHLLGLDKKFGELDQGAAEGHRRHRRRLRRAAEPVQHRRPLLLGQPVRQARPQDDVLRVLRARRRCCTPACPAARRAGSKLAFVGAVCIILSMYGGGFATVPAYLSDLFGTQMVGAIHGRLLTAWSTAGILGPVVVNYMRDYQLGLGIPREQVYNQTMYILVGFLVVGLIANLLDPAGRPEVLHDRRRAGRGDAAWPTSAPPPPRWAARPPAARHDAARATVALAWAAVGIPLAWGVYMTLDQCSEVLQLTT